MGLLIALIIWVLFVTAGYFVGKRKGRVGAGRPGGFGGRGRGDHHGLPAPLATDSRPVSAHRAPEPAPEPAPGLEPCRVAELSRS